MVFLKGKNPIIELFPLKVYFIYGPIFQKLQITLGFVKEVLFQ
jgi:hypothetical protein